MGTPGFACKPLQALYESTHEVAAVVTGRAKRRGRGADLCPTEVCCLAHELGLPVLTPSSLKSDELYDQLEALAPDIFVVVAFRILPERLFTLPRYGSINIHGSLLPKYRGAAPIHWALINGETETGLTSFLLNAKVDTGNIIWQESTPVGPDENYDSLYERLSEMSGPFLLTTLQLIQQPGFRPRGQDETAATPAPKLTPEDAFIDFGLPAGRVHNFVRGLSSKPGACTTFRGKKLKILAARVAQEGASGVRPGSIVADKKRLLVQCADMAVQLLQVVPEGKKTMDGLAFINGFRPQAGEILGLPWKGGETVNENRDSD